MGLVSILVALIVGAGLAVQAGINAHLRHWVGEPVRVALVSFLVGTLALAVYSVLLPRDWPSPARLLGAPWWVWTGGLLGAFGVAATTTLVPRLGTASLLALVVVGQTLASLVLDHFGLLGVPQHPISPLRVVGAILLVTGVGLVRLF